MSVRVDQDEKVLDQAIAWHQALDHADADWDGYLVWLNASSGNRAVFDEIALLDRAITEHAEDLRARLEAVRARQHPAQQAAWVAADATGHGDQDRRRMWGWWIGGAIAAALAFFMAAPRLLVADAVYQTAAGESRQIALGNGEAIQLAPATRLIARRGDPHRLELAQGEAYFSVPHDPKRVLSIKAGGFAVTDIGTRFGVKVAGDSVTVSVAEGRVTMRAGSGAARLVAAGQQLVGSGGTLALPSAVALQDVGSWRSGRLVYDRTPLHIVVADLARFSGRRVTVEPGIGERPFSGALGISNGSRPFQDLADLMGISYKMDGRDVHFVGDAAR